MDRDTRTNDDGILNHDNTPTTGDEVGQAVGGVSGTVAGAAIGSIAGPIGTVIGGIAGAVGGWWAGRAVSESAKRFDDQADTGYRQAYDSRSDRLADRSYEDVRPAYQLGHLASENPDYTGKSFESIEEDLQRGWSNDLRARHGDWSTVRPYAEEAYSSRSSVSTRESMNQMENSSENLADRAGNSTRNAGERIMDGVDDMKDRVDGNPASKPGADPTDSRF